MTLSAAHRRFLIVDYGVISAVVNFVLNGAIAWLLFRSAASIPLWGPSSVAVDTLITSFLLPFLTCLVVSGVVDRHVAQGRVARLSSDRVPLASWSNRSSVERGIVVGAAGVALAALPVIAILSALGVSGFALWSFIGFKAGFAACLAAAVTPLIGWWALIHASKQAA